MLPFHVQGLIGQLFPIFRPFVNSLQGTPILGPYSGSVLSREGVATPHFSSAIPRKRWLLPRFHGRGSFTMLQAGPRVNDPYDWYDSQIAAEPAADWDELMNYGMYTDPIHPGAAVHPQSHMANLYFQLVEGTNITGLRVLEVGSGRGGGARLLQRYYHPSVYVGMDLVHSQVESANSRLASFGSSSLVFVQGDACQIPFPNNSFDVVINVESSHNYNPFEAFLAEVQRVLVPNGKFLFEDFRDDEHAMGVMIEQVQARFGKPMEIVDITSNVKISIEMHAEYIEQRIQQCEKFANRQECEGYWLSGGRFPTRIFRIQLEGLDKRSYREPRELESFQVGEAVEGKVTKLVPFGAFLDIGAKINALLHISQMPNNSIAEASKELAVGDIIMCHVKSINSEKRQISLTQRRALAEYTVGSDVEGKVVRVVNFGGFVDIGAVTDAFLHVSEITDDYIEDASSILTEGDSIKGRIIEIENARNRISLTCKFHVVVEPKQLPCTSAVVWLHGFNSNPHSWEQEFKKLMESHPSWKWIFLRAHNVPQTHRWGKRAVAWGDYLEEDCTRVGSRDYDNNMLVSDETIQEVHRTINDLQLHDKVNAQRIFIGGFSMGATAAAASALTYPGQLAGIAILSGWLVPAAREALKSHPPIGLPVLISHGTEDDAVGFDCGQEASKLLEESGASVNFVAHKGMNHHDGAYNAGKDEAAKFIEEIFSEPWD